MGRVSSFALTRSCQISRSRIVGREASFTGMLDELHLYNRALFAAEAEYLSDPTP
jgi:hypothetical protein